MDESPDRQPGADTEACRPELADLDERPVAEQVALFVEDEFMALQVLRDHLGPLAAAIEQVADRFSVGPALLAGSTRLAAGTVQKVMLNALSTLVMVRTGRTYGNLMVDLHVTNSKLRTRARRLVTTISGVDADTAERLLDDTDGEVKTAVLAAATGLPAESARGLLARHRGRLRTALQTSTSEPEEERHE